MKNTYTANSMCSLKSGYNDSNYFSRSNRSMIPILTTDFESRLMLNSKLPHKKSLSEEIRKNDFIVDFHSNYRTPTILMNCLNVNDSETDEKLAKKKEPESTNSSIKSLISESFKTFNLIDITRTNCGAFNKSASQQIITQHSANVNYIKPWVESSCKSYSSYSLVQTKKKTIVSLNKNNYLTVFDRAQSDFNNNNKNIIKNIETNDQFIIKNIEFNQKHQSDKNDLSESFL